MLEEADLMQVAFHADDRRLFGLALGAAWQTEPLVLGDHPDGVDDAGNITEDGKQDVYPELLPDAHLQEHAERRQDNREMMRSMSMINLQWSGTVGIIPRHTGLRRRFARVSQCGVHPARKPGPEDSLRHAPRPRERPPRQAI